MFNRLADFIEHEFDQTVKAVTAMIEPAMIVVMGAVIGFIAISMLLPMFQSAQVVVH